MLDESNSLVVETEEDAPELALKKRKVQASRGLTVYQEKTVLGSSDSPRVSNELSSKQGAAERVTRVCKLFVTKVAPSYSMPWKRETQSSSTSSGFIVQLTPGPQLRLENTRFIVTNAHCVHRATSVLVRGQAGDPIKFTAKVVSIALPLDLALLQVDDARFWKDKRPLELKAVLPHLDDNVTAVGFPTGGDNVSVTRGVVSRIDINALCCLRIQIDAAINPGNSGGPVFDKHNNVIGVAHAKASRVGVSGIGYVIPTEIVERFLENYRANPNDPKHICDSRPLVKVVDKSAPAVPMPASIWGPGAVSDIGVIVQTLENKALRRKLLLPEESTYGIRVAAILPLGSAKTASVVSVEKSTTKSPSHGDNDQILFDKEEKGSAIKVDDVLLEIDGVKISQNGTIQLRSHERISWRYLVTKLCIGRPVLMRCSRQGQIRNIRMETAPRLNLLPQIDGYDAFPMYMIFGGMVFVPLSFPWVIGKRNSSSTRSLFNKHSEMLENKGEQVVVLSSVLSHTCNHGYHELRNIALDTFNGHRCNNLADLALRLGQAIKSAKSDSSAKFAEFRFFRDHSSSGHELVVLNIEDCLIGDANLRAQHLIAAPCSPEIVPFLNDTV